LTYFRVEICPVVEKKRGGLQVYQKESPHGEGITHYRRRHSPPSQAGSKKEEIEEVIRIPASNTRHSEAWEEVR